MRAPHTDIGMANQRGAALLVMLVIMIMGALTFLVGSLSKPGMQIERASKTYDVLAQAKDSLIAYAVSSSSRPGNLPCPDRDAPGTTGYGDAEGSCSSAGGTTVGRLPWKTLGLPELVDDTGEPLWYALSNNFRENNTPVINSDNMGTLSIFDNDGATLLTPPGSEAAAIVFSPGSIVGSQQRNSITDKTTSSNYLDSYAFPPPISATRNNAITNGPFIKGMVKDTSDSTVINDRLIYITADQLFPAIEKLVGKEIENGIKSMLNDYFAAWSAFPFAAPFDTPPSASSFTGQPATYNGLLPIGNIVNSTATLSWDTFPAPRYYIDGVFQGTCTFNSGGASNSRLRCGNTSWPYVTVPAGKTFTFTGTLKDVGFGFWRPHDINSTWEVRARNTSGNPVLVTSLFAPNSVTITNSINPDGSATITFSAIGKSGGTWLQRVELRDIQSASTASLPIWLLPNNWHELAHYGVSAGYAAGGGNTCAPLPGTPSCLTVNGSGGGTDKRVVVVMMNKALTGKTHTTSNLSDYMESENTTPADYIYENNTRSSTFNDQVIIVAP